MVVKRTLLTGKGGPYADEEVDYTRNTIKKMDVIAAAKAEMRARSTMRARVGRGRIIKGKVARKNTKKGKK